MFILNDSIFVPGKIQYAVFRRNELCFFQHRSPAHHNLISCQWYRLDSIPQHFVLLFEYILIYFLWLQRSILPKSLQSWFVILVKFDWFVVHCRHQFLQYDQINRTLPISTVLDRYNQSFLSPPAPPAWPPTSVLLVMLLAPSNI